MFYNGNIIDEECVKNFTVAKNLNVDIDRGIRVYENNEEIAYIDICSTGTNTIKISKLFVSKPNRKKGIGKYLVGEVLLWAETQRIENIEVKASTFTDKEMAKVADTMAQTELEGFYQKYLFSDANSNGKAIKLL